MKLLYLSPDYGIPVLGYKGAAVHVRSMVAALGRAGHQVVLISPMATASGWDTPEPLAAKFVHLPASDELLACIDTVEAYGELLATDTSLAKDLRRILYDRHLATHLLRRYTRLPPDCIYTRAALHSLAPVALSKATGRPLVVELNAPLAEEHATYRGGGADELAARAEQRLLREADAVLVVSRLLAEHAYRCGVAEERVHVVPNAVDPDLFHPAPRSQQLRAHLGVGDGPVLGFVGGLRQWHGVECLPDLLQRLITHFPGVQLVVVGEGPLHAPLQLRFAELDLHERVVFTGALSHRDIAAVIREFDVALAPYPQLEHDFYFSPLKLFEYMACGAAVVAADVGQISAIVQHGKNGLLYRAGDLDGLVDCCQRLLFDPSFQDRLGAMATHTILTQYTWDGNAGRVTEIIEGLR
ncbi:MAG: glycosyltransferase family 4 protein [Pseudomonadota bacterium]